MPARRNSRWSTAELATLRNAYPTGGASAAHAVLPARSVHSIQVKAHKLGLRSQRINPAPVARLAGDRLKQAIVLREEQGWSFARIGAKFGVSEAGACNAVTAALCTQRGFTPAQRDEHGRLTAQGIERLRFALKKGLKACDIQLRLGLSAGRIAEERRRYNAELKSRGLALLPPPGGGAAYSGVKLTREKKAEVEDLFLQGLGTLKVHERTGVSKTSCTRIRARLVRRLRRKGEALPGCDLKGARGAASQSLSYIHPLQLAELHRLLRAGVPCAAAADLCAIGRSSAYAARDRLAVRLAEAGDHLPPPKRASRGQGQRLSFWPPYGPAQFYAFRARLHAAAPGTTLADLREQWRSDRQAAGGKTMAWEEIDNVRPVNFAAAVPAEGIRCSARKMGTRGKSGDKTSWIQIQIGSALARKLSLTLETHRMRLLFGTGDEAGQVGICVDQERGKFKASRKGDGAYSLSINGASAEGLFALEFPTFAVTSADVVRPPNLPAVATFKASEDMLAVD